VIMFWDRQGQPMEMLAWAEKFEHDDAYRIVAQHWVRGWKVSTIWDGLNGGFNPFSQGPALIFETRIFAPADATIGGEDRDAGTVVPGVTVADLDQYQERYATEAAAQAGHDRAIAALAALLGADAMADIAGPLVPGSSDSEWDGSLPEA
jgi:hypothetical protein